VTQGDTLKGLYIVQDGKVLLTRLSVGGKETILGFAGPGGFFGDVPLLRGSAAPFNALAIQRTVLLVVGKREFDRMLEDASSSRALMTVLAGRCDDAWAQIEALGSGCLEDRIRGMLHWLCDRMGVWTPEGVEITMNQGQLAQMVGATRESLNRQLRVLKREGILKVRAGGRASSSLLIPDPGRLGLPGA
jgi:CRP-like cAMP-binding protein